LEEQAEKWGYIRADGTVAIKPRFEEAHDFSCGLAPVMLDGKWAYIGRGNKASFR
jgi:hypothetical protein